MSRTPHATHASGRESGAGLDEWMGNLHGGAGVGRQRNWTASGCLAPCVESAMATVTGCLCGIEQSGPCKPAPACPVNPRRPPPPTHTHTFSPPPSPAPSQADLNGDGHLEIILATQDLKIQVGWMRVWGVGGATEIRCVCYSALGESGMFWAGAVGVGDLMWSLSRLLPCLPPSPSPAPPPLRCCNQPVWRGDRAEVSPPLTSSPRCPCCTSA